jgi:ABC-type multidrug transport system ATPase subunit
MVKNCIRYLHLSVIAIICSSWVGLLVLILFQFPCKVIVVVIAFFKNRIADEGKIVIVITHTPDRVIDLFDDVIVLAKDLDRTGRLAYYGPVKEAYEFFRKDGMEGILLSINQKDEGGEGRADEFVEKYADRIREKVG